MVSSKKALYHYHPSQSPHFFEAHIFSFVERPSYWYLGLLGSHKWTLSSANFCLWFSPQVHCNQFGLQHPFLGLRCSYYVCPCKPACTPSRQGHPFSHGRAITLPKKSHYQWIDHSWPTTPYIYIKQVIQPMSYLKSRSSSTYWIRMWLCIIRGIWNIPTSLIDLQKCNSLQLEVSASVSPA